MDELMATLYESKKQMSISFDLKKNEITINTDEDISKYPSVLPIVINKDFSTPTLVSINLENHRMLVGCSIEQDEFVFGLLVKKIEDQLTAETELFMCSVLRDCNYNTFLKSKTQDRYQRLVKRIFLV